MNFHLKSREISHLSSSLSGILCVYLMDMDKSIVTGFLKECGNFCAVIRSLEVDMRYRPNSHNPGVISYHGLKLADLSGYGLTHIVGVGLGWNGTQNAAG